MERILVASTHRGDGMFIGILMPEIQHDTWCKQLNQKGICNCEPDIFIETNDGRFEINMQGKLEKIVWGKKWKPCNEKTQLLQT